MFSTLKNKNISCKVTENHIIVLHKDKQLFKVSNNIDNATNLLKLINR